MTARVAVEKNNDKADGNRLGILEMFENTSVEFHIVTVFCMCLGSSSFYFLFSL